MRNKLGSGYGARASARSSSAIRRAPATRSLETYRGHRVRHREYIADVNSSSSFAFQAFGINPADAGTFPWLSQIAQQYEEYKFNYLKFVYVTTCTDSVAVTTTNWSLGAIMMATEYNSLNPPFANKQQMDSYQGAVSCKPSVSCEHIVNCTPHHAPMDIMYTRTTHFTSSAAFGNLLQYDLGQFYFATQGQKQDTPGPIGELWVEYDVTLMKPRINPLVSQTSPVMDFYSSVATAPSGTNPLPGSLTLLGSTTAGVTSGPNGFVNITSSTGGVTAVPLNTYGSSITIGATTDKTTLNFNPEDPPGTVVQVTYRVIGTAAACVPFVLTGNMVNCTGHSLSGVTSALAAQTAFLEVLYFIKTSVGAWGWSPSTAGVVAVLPTAATMFSVWVSYANGFVNPLFSNGLFPI